MKKCIRNVAVLLTALAVGTTFGQERERHFTARQAFNYSTPILFHSNFAANGFDKLNLSIDVNYRLPESKPGRLEIANAPVHPSQKVLSFTVPRAENSFRSEIALPSEKGFQERYYQIRVLVPEDWHTDHNPGADIIMQWHAVSGDWRPTHPNLAIVIDGEHWSIRQSFGDPKTKPIRTRKQLVTPLKRGDWVTWTVHARWSPDKRGLIRIWRNETEVGNLIGPNVYTTIGTEYTPYLKSGIYHPEWNTKGNQRRQKAFAAETDPVTQKQIFVSHILVASKEVDLSSILPNKRNE